MFTPRWLAGFVLLLAVFPLAADPIKVACIGDSITEGAGLSNPSSESYPARLQRLLGTNYVVRNYGVSGRTLLKKGDYPYWKEAYYKQSHDWLPDVVTIKLGTNDSKPYNWKYGTNYVAELEELVTTYATLASAPRIYLCTPCPVYGTGAFDISPGVVATNIVPAVRDIAARLGLGLVDFHVRMAGHQEWFPDTVHPNTRGAAAMAAVLSDTLSGGPPGGPTPPVEIVRLPPTRVIISWPAEWAGLIAQQTTALRFSNSVWTVTDPVPGRAGDRIFQTNTISGALRAYRLVKP